MFKNEKYYSHKKDINFSVAISNIHKKVITEYKLKQTTHRYRQWDLNFHVDKNDNERYTCDNHDEFINVLSSISYFDRFTWHNTYTPETKVTKVSEEGFGVGIDYSQHGIEIGVHTDNNLGFIERVHDIIRNELGLERPKRLDDHPNRRKVLNPTIFIARHFDKKSDEYYSILSEFLYLLGFTVSQGEEYKSDSIPEKVKREIEQQDIVIVNVSGDRAHNWLISESSYSLGKGKHVIMLIESVTQIDTGILGKDLEYIPYPENEIEKVFSSLLREFRSIGVKGIFY